MAMGQLHIDSGASSDLAFDHITFTSPHGCVSINDNGPDSNILFDHDRLDNMETEGVGGCLAEGSISMWGGGGSPGWLTISNSHFGGNTLPGCSDGIQIGGDGAKIGPGNEFTGKFQGNCVAHSDPLQFYAPSGVNNNIVTGNWFHGNTTGCMCWGGGGANDTLTNNVFESIGYWSIVAGAGENNWLIAHNVFGDDVTMDNGHSAPNGTGNVVRDNVWLPGKDISDKGSGVSYDHNLNSGKSGTGNINGTPVFLASPSSGYYHYQLVLSSPGYQAASDGKSLGIAP